MKHRIVMAAMSGVFLAATSLAAAQSPAKKPGSQPDPGAASAVAGSTKAGSSMPGSTARSGPAAVRRDAGIVTQSSGAGNGTSAPGDNSVKGGSANGGTGH
jgi:hypothetical protein